MTGCFRYSAFALGIESEIELPELGAGTEDPELFIRRGSVPRGRWTTVKEEVGFNLLAARYLIRNGTEIIVEPIPGVDPLNLRTAVTGRLMAYLMRQRGWLPLHGSAVVIDGRAAVLMGEKGSGKSTTAAAFHARGHLIVSDDLSPIQRSGPDCELSPAGSRVKLLENSCKVMSADPEQGSIRFDKFEFNVSRGPLRKTYPVSRIYILGCADSLRSQPVKQSAAIVELARHSVVRRRAMDRAASARFLADCASVAQAVPVHLLGRTMDIEALGDLVTMVERELARHG